MKSIKRSFAAYGMALAAILALSGVASASSVLVDLSDFAGSRTSPNGITATGGYASGMTVAWNITFNAANDLYTYVYTLSSSGKNFSHFILETSSTFTTNNMFSGTSGPTALALYTKTSNGNSDPGLPGDLYGIKFDYGSHTSTYTLVTDRAPVWGDFYTKGGQEYAFNANFGTDPTASTINFSGWIATPDTNSGPPPSGIAVDPTPLPAAAWGGAALMLGLAGTRIVRRKRLVPARA